MTTASKITLVRVVMIPAYLVTMYLSQGQANLWMYLSLAIFIIASLTDFGKFADPLADKMLTTAALLWFVECGQMPAWALLVVLIREFAVSGLRMIASDKGRVIAAGWSGKVKTASTMVCIILMFLPIPAAVNTLCVAVIVLTTIYSGVEYFMKNLDVLSEVK